MTTKEAAEKYAAEHIVMCKGKKWVTYNPNNLPENELPIIYGFNNGGSDDFKLAVALAEDGTVLGTHICSHECYMEHDLGIIEGSRPDRHENDYQKHYPNGYRMEFIEGENVKTHNGLNLAHEENQKKKRTQE